MIKPFAFVLMPFHEEFDDIYKLGIQASAAECDVIAERVDEQTYSETVLERIYRQIHAADFIIADMTGQNPNVFYEVGYAHAKGKLCTLLTQTVDDIPFDLKQHRHIVYGQSIQTLKSCLKSEFEWLHSEVKRLRKRPLTVKLRKALGNLSKNDWRAESEIELVFDIHNESEERSPDIDGMYLHTSDRWTVFQDDKECPSVESPVEKGSRQHFIKPPVSRIASDAWAQLSVQAKQVVWWKHEGTELQENYRHRGILQFEIRTSEGSYIEDIAIDVTSDEIPF